MLLAAGKDDKGKLAGAVLMAQLLKTAEAIRDYHQQTGNLRQAQLVHQQVVTQLQAVKLPGYAPDPATLSAGDREVWAARQRQHVPPPQTPGQAPGSPPGSPLPSVLEVREPTGARTTNQTNDQKERDRGAGR